MAESTLHLRLSSNRSGRLTPSCRSSGFCSAAGSVTRRSRISRPSVVGRTMSALCSVDSSAVLSLATVVPHCSLRSAKVLERLRVAQECHHHMSLHPRLFLMEQRTNGQFALQSPKGRLGFGQLRNSRQSLRSAFISQISRTPSGVSRRNYILQIVHLGMRGLNPSQPPLHFVAIFQPAVAMALASPFRSSSIRVENRFRIAFSFSLRPAARHRMLVSSPCGIATCLTSTSGLTCGPVVFQ